MQVFKLYREQILPIPKEQCWEFFSKPQNLKKITPDYMGFDIVEGGDGPMYAGQIIIYTVSPIFNLKITWVTEITHVRDGDFFVDEQRFGPYKLWHHKHYFESVPGGTKCIDEVHYLPPMGPLAPLLNRFCIEKKLKQIFDYRQNYLRETFGELN